LIKKEREYRWGEEKVESVWGGKNIRSHGVGERRKKRDKKNMPGVGIFLGFKGGGGKHSSSVSWCDRMEDAAGATKSCLHCLRDRALSVLRLMPHPSSTKEGGCNGF